MNVSVSSMKRLSIVKPHTDYALWECGNPVLWDFHISTRRFVGRQPHRDEAPRSGVAQSSIRVVVPRVSVAAQYVMRWGVAPSQ
jgi:hypothetical protein